MSKDCNYHLPVLFEETIRALAIKPSGTYVDCTAGGGGHSAGLLKELKQPGCLIAIDRDLAAIEACRQKLENVITTGKYEIIHDRFANIDRILLERGIGKVDGIMADLGVSSAQLDRADRGFSYSQDGPLDMRMDATGKTTAADLINYADQKVLANILREYGEERYAGRIAAAIVERRKTREFHNTADLADLIIKVMPGRSRREKHPAKRSFQAIRIAVNAELDQLTLFLEKVPALLKPGGRLAVISFHSLEDRLVKTKMREWENPCTCPLHLPCICGRNALGRIIERKGVVATEEEQKNNPRARSARLRIFERNETLR